RSREDAAVDDHRPDADEAMIGTRAGTDTEDRALVDGCDEFSREAAGHVAGDRITPSGARRLPPIRRGARESIRRLPTRARARRDRLDRPRARRARAGA